MTSGVCGQISWRLGTGGIFACKRPILSLGRDAKMRPVPLLGGRRLQGFRYAETGESNTRRLDGYKRRAPITPRPRRPRVGGTHVWPLPRCAPITPRPRRPRVGASACLAHLIEAKGVSQTQLSSATGIANSTISEILKGKRFLNRRHVGKLAKYFNVSPGVFAF